MSGEREREREREREMRGAVWANMSFNILGIFYDICKTEYLCPS
jgi:hypothetical protein